MQALRAAHAFDGTRFLPEGATVLVEGDRIAGVHPGRFDLPDAVAVMEYEGTLLPGLFDCHTHLVADSTFGGLERVATMSDDAVDAVIEESLSAHLAAGVTTVRDLGDRGYRTLAFRASPGLPRVVPSGPPITTPGGHCHYLGGEVTDVRAAVAERAERGVDVVKVMASGGFATPGTDQLGAQFTVTELAMIVDTAHRAGLPVVAHAHSLIGMQNAVAAGVDGIEHFTGLSAEGGARIDDDLLDEVARRRVVVDLTVGNDRRLHALMPAPPPAVAALMVRFGVASFDDFYAHRVALFGRLREHVVPVVAGVDSGIGPTKRHGNAWRAVVDMVEGGYPAAEARAAATSSAADACGLSGETGRLAVGCSADLLVVDGDLSADIAVLGRPRAVLVRGRSAAVA